MAENGGFGGRASGLRVLVDDMAAHPDLQLLEEESPELFGQKWPRRNISEDSFATVAPSVWSC